MLFLTKAFQYIFLFYLSRELLHETEVLRHRQTVQYSNVRNLQSDCHLGGCTTETTEQHSNGNSNHLVGCIGLHQR